MTKIWVVKKTIFDASCDKEIDTKIVRMTRKSKKHAVKIIFKAWRKAMKSDDVIEPIMYSWGMSYKLPNDTGVVYRLYKCSVYENGDVSNLIRIDLS